MSKQSQQKKKVHVAMNNVSQTVQQDFSFDAPTLKQTHPVKNDFTFDFVSAPIQAP
jgi:hypothetical protein